MSFYSWLCNEHLTGIGGYRIFTVMLMMYRVRGAILIGILLTSIVSWPRPTAVTFFPHTPSGDIRFDYFKQVVAFHPLKLIGNVINVGQPVLTVLSSYSCSLVQL